MTSNISSQIIETRKLVPQEAIPSVLGGIGIETSTVLTNTTTVNQKIGESVTNVSYVPYMRGLAIQFVGYKLRPERQIFYFFDNTLMDAYVQRPNIIETSSKDSTLKDILKGNRETVVINGSTAKILHTETSEVDGNTRIYVENFESASAISVGDTITSQNSSYTSTVTSYQHFSGLVGTSSNNSNIVLSSDAETATDDYYVGNVITIVTGTNAGQSAEIVSYNAATRTANVNPVLANVTANTIYSIGDKKNWYSSRKTQTSYITSRGMTSGVLHIPDPSQHHIKFKTGDRIFRIIDNDSNDTSYYTTRADYRFVSNGLNMSRAQLIERKVTEEYVTTIGIIVPPTPTPTPTSSITPTTSRTPTPTSSITPTSSTAAGVTPTPTPTVTPVSSGTPVPVTPTRTATPTASSVRPADCFPPAVGNEGGIIREVVGLRNKIHILWMTLQYNLEYRPVFDMIRGNWFEMFDFPKWDNMLRALLPTTSAGLNMWANQVLALRPRALACRGIPFIDPIAQSFYVDATNHKDGIFVSSIDLFFKNKGTLPIEVQIRPNDNGYPSSNTVIPGAVALVDPDDIVLSDLPNVSNSMTNTRITFSSPVYLNSGYEYSIVVISDELDYDLYVSELGKTVIGSTNIVSKQPFSGSVFKSQNARTWNAIQDEDLMFVINQCEFDTSGTLYMEDDKSKSPSSNTVYDSFELQSDAIEFTSTNLDYYYKSTTNSTGVIESVYTNFKPDNRVDPLERKVITGNSYTDKSFDTRVDLFTQNPDVSPVVFHNRQNFVAIENIINNTGLTNDRFVIDNPGSSYSSNASVTLSSNSGYGANAYAVANVTTGNIESIIVDNAGTGYVDDVSATISGGGGSGANVVVSTETLSSGGPALTRYISKTITLLDGFNAGDIRVFVTAVKPAGANVELYYKVRNSLDTDPIERRNWKRMVQKTSQFTYSTNGEQIEYEYRPSLTSNNIVYTNGTTTFKTFNQFAVKIVLTSDGTTANKIPYVYDVRAIALPEDVY